MHFSFKFKWTVLREFRCRTKLQMILSVGRAVVPTKPLIYQDLSLNETKINATLAMGHQANPAHCYKFHILQTNSQCTIFYNIILGLRKTTNSQDRYPAIQCPCPGSMPMFRQHAHVQAACPCPCCMSMSMSMLFPLVHAACSCPRRVSMFMLRANVHDACQCSCCVPMFMLRANVHDACQCSCCVPISMLHARVYAACPYISMLVMSYIKKLNFMQISKI